MRLSNKGIIRVIALAFLLLAQNPFLFAQDNSFNPAEIYFQSNGDKIHGWFYKAEGTGTFPTVILLHGYPGGDGDLFGLGKKLIKKSINAFTFNYSGTWKSEGTYLPETSLRDVINSVQFLRKTDISKRYNIDTTQIVLLGYSYGSGMALLGSLPFPSLEKAISIGTSDLSVITGMIENSEEYRMGHQAYLDKYMSDSTVSRGLGGKSSHEWLFEHKDDYNLVKHAKELAGKQVLLIGGWRDNLAVVETHSIPLFRELNRNGAKDVKIKVYDTDHSFKNMREQLFRDILDWIRK